MASADQIQTHLSKSEALLLVTTDIHASYTTVVDRDGIATRVSSLSAAELSSMVQRLRQSLDLSIPKTDRIKFDTQIAYQLYAELIKPAMDAFPKKSHIFVVLEGPMASLPLNVLLVDQPGTKASYADFPWFDTKYAVTLVPSASSFVAMRSGQNIVHQDANRSRFLGFGSPLLAPVGSRCTNPDGIKFDPSDPGIVTRQLCSLPLMADLLSDIAKELGVAFRDTVRTGEQATLSQFLKDGNRLGKADVIAIATHGLLPSEAFDIARTYEPALVLTPTSFDNGLLTASTIARLNLSAQWVILPACNTASSDEGLEDAPLSGLAEAFMRAGARALLVSNWSVDEAATSLLMARVLQDFAKDGDKAVAVQHAMQWLRNYKEGPSSYSEPAYWAAFSQIGE